MVSITKKGKAFLFGVAVWALVILFNMLMDRVLYGHLIWGEYLKMTGWILIAVILGRIYFSKTN
ncbi:hypothetical protein F9B82_02185 [Lacticaseibacillus casei]|uniref:Uncharacterized protein n=1 Tax=Lacticaseibacillus casei TaxID=1582 RepID=A0AAN1F037_LACCA|nr:hypothetical protein BGL52_11080 [Lacticaseibacillus casei]KAB1971463.1 hypothetical protein F9B82_02185 [Lacticaseibacillus casei]